MAVKINGEVGGHAIHPHSLASYLSKMSVRKLSSKAMSNLSAAATAALRSALSTVTSSS
eukprot:CAMPEP_0172849496 /NCGR_PEP_ID=MMETSP1075-20121228/46474_1 /TAXON_ID=2916 /ORGANISM="Ceratium fusus, Strain PA161109" /LENGTH=58 /DNA_ID=CAMNT_0013695089 /DNA_START=20 /DNA_END=193 /DNA_ORIENTATION=+